MALNNNSNSLIMEELSDSIILITQENSLIDSLEVRELPIMIHPYNAFYDNDLVHNIDYPNNRDDFMERIKTPILVGIDPSYYQISIDWIIERGVESPRAFYMTKEKNPEPLKANKKDFIKSLKEIFNAETIILGGAELHLRKNSELMTKGCINHFYRMIKNDFKVRISHSICWKYP